MFHSKKKIVITGTGICCSLGSTTAEYFQRLLGGHSGIRRPESPEEFDLFPSFPLQGPFTYLGAFINDIDQGLERSERRYPRPMKALLKAIREAFQQSGADLRFPNSGQASEVPLNMDRVGCLLTGPACAIFETERFVRSYLRQENRSTRTWDILYSSMDSILQQVTRQYDLRGPRHTLLTACSSAGVALGLAFEILQQGEADVMVVGGGDGFSELTLAGFLSLKSLSNRPCRPFDQERDGLTLGEGAGILILEDHDHAVQRKAPILAEIAGYGLWSEGHHLTAPHPQALGYIESMQEALASAGVLAGEIDHINAHGTATRLNDLAEAMAIKHVFPDKAPPVNSIKGQVGHCMGASGAVEAVTCVLSLIHQVIPATGNFKTPDPEIGLDIVGHPTWRPLQYVLCNSAGFGGNNSSVLFKRN